jgi:hypothetical protein
MRKVLIVLTDAKLAFEGRRMLIDASHVDQIALLCGFTGNRRIRRKKCKRFISKLMVTIFEYLRMQQRMADLRKEVEHFEVVEVSLNDFWDMITKERSK